MQQRIEFIDLAKGVCIILVVLLHIVPSANIPELRFIRIPLYFILSGLFFKNYGSFKNFLKKKTNNILIPFLFFYIISYIAFYIVKTIAPDIPVANATGILDIFTQRSLFNGPLWFLLCLFWTNLYFEIICVAFQKELFRAATVLSIGLIGAILLKYDILLPMYLDVAMRSLPIFYIGFILKKSPILYPNKYDKYNILFILVLGSLFVLMLSTHPSIPFESTTWRGGFLGYITSATGVLALLMICKIIKYIPIISYFGRYSIIVLCTHHLIYRPILLGTSLFSTNSILTTWIVFVLTLIITYFLIPICIKYIPYVTAQKNIFELKLNHQ